MNRIAAIVLAGAVLASSAFAADTVQLAPGKPAGVQKAQAGTPMLLWILGLGIVGGGIALVSTNGTGNQPSASTTGTSP